VREADRTLDEVAEAVATYYGLTVDELVSGRESYRARRIAKHLALRITHSSLSQIGRYFGGVHSNNVLHADRSVERDMYNDATFGAEVLALKGSLVIRT
jgi:chromosomal replication initiator protein